MVPIWIRIRELRPDHQARALACAGQEIVDQLIVPGLRLDVPLGAILCGVVVVGAVGFAHVFVSVLRFAVGHDEVEVDGLADVVIAVAFGWGVAF